MCLMNTEFQPSTPQQQLQPHHSRYRGVTWDKRDGKWRVRISVLGTQHNIGRYFDQEQAARVYDKMAYTLYGNSAITNFGVAAAAASTCRVPQFIHRLRAKLDEWTVQQQAQQQLRQVTPFATAATLGMVGAGGQHALQAGTWSPSAAAGLASNGSVLAPATPGSLLGLEQQLQAPTNGSYMLLAAPQQVMSAQQQQQHMGAAAGMVAPNNIYVDMSAATSLPVWGNHMVPASQYPAGLVDTPSLAQQPPSYLQPYTQGCIPTPPQQALHSNPAKLAPFPGAGGSPVLGLDLLPAWARQLPTAVAGGGEGGHLQQASAALPQQQLGGGNGATLLAGMSQPEPALAGPGVLMYSSSTTPSGPSWQVALDCTLDAPPTSGNLPPATPGRLSVTDRGPGVPMASGLDLAALLRKQQLLQGYNAKQQQHQQGAAQQQHQQLDAATLAACMGSMPLVGTAPAGAASSGVDTLGWSMNGLALV